MRDLCSTSIATPQAVGLYDLKAIAKLMRLAKIMPDEDGMKGKL